MPSDTSAISIRQIKSSAELTQELLASLVELLADAVRTNSSVGFMANSTTKDFEEFWRAEFERVAHGNIVLIAERSHIAVGSVIVTREQRANGRHRAEFRKLLVHSAQIGRAHV